jgi:4-amino-4-deoxy-L-arabinose transferase-like glycosyltransferase
MTDRHDRRIPRGLQAAVFLGFLCLYVLTMKGICIRDNVLHYDRTQSVIHRGMLSMPRERYDLVAQPWLKFFMAQGRDGRLYLTLGDGLSLAALPLGLIGNMLDRAAGLPPYEQMLRRIDQERRRGTPESLEEAMRGLRRMPSAFFVALVNPLVTAVTVLLFFKLCYALTGSLSKAGTGCLLLGTGTIVWVYSSTFWTQPLVTFCILGAFYHVSRAETTGGSSRFLAAGALLGCAFITRYFSLLAVPCLVLYVARRRLAGERPTLRPLVFLSAPVVCALLLQMGWNSYRFGSPLQSGGWHQAEAWASFGASLPVSLGAMLVGLHKSIFLFSPPLILGVLGLKRSVKMHRVEVELVVAAACAYLLAYGHFALWYAPGSWGPRFLVPITPLLLLPACAFLDGARWKKCLVIGLLAVGVAIQLIGVLLPLQRLAVLKYLGGLPTSSDLFLKPEILPQARAVLAGNVELWFLDGPIKGAAGGVLVAVLVSSLAYWIFQVKREQ